jgi:hypothetical protein
VFRPAGKCQAPAGPAARRTGSGAAPRARRFRPAARRPPGRHRSAVYRGREDRSSRDRRDHHPERKEHAMIKSPLAVPRGRQLRLPASDAATPAASPRSSSSSSAAAAPAGPARTPVPGDAAPACGNAVPPRASAHPATPATVHRLR